MGIIIIFTVFLMYYIITLYQPANRLIKRVSSDNDAKLLCIIGEVKFIFLIKLDK